MNGQKYFDGISSVMTAVKTYPDLNQFLYKPFHLAI